MLKKILLAGALLTPLVTFSQSNTAVDHANSNASFQGAKVGHAPEIDGGNAILGLTLLAGLVSLAVRKNKRNKKED
jgi:hypothetical protein